MIRETESLPLGSFSENEETSNGLVCLFVQFVYLLFTMLNKRKKASLKLQGLQESSKNNAFSAAMFGSRVTICISRILRLGLKC